MIPVGPVAVRRTLDAPRERVWYALTDPDIRQFWWADLSFEATQGGELTEFWVEGDVRREAQGVIDVFVVGHALGFRWQDVTDFAPTRVLISLSTVANQTLLSISEIGFDVFPDAAHRVRATYEGWEIHLDDLEAALLSGDA